MDTQVVCLCERVSFPPPKPAFHPVNTTPPGEQLRITADSGFKPRTFYSSLDTFPCLKVHLNPELPHPRHLTTEHLKQ